ncbi:hypothetical protein [Catenulispora yoronensis]
MEKEAAAHREDIRAITVPVVGDQTTDGVEAGITALTGPFAQRAREHHAMVHELLAVGYGIHAIARHLVGDGTPSSDTPEPSDGRTWSRGRPKRPSDIDPFTPYVLQRWDQGHTNVLQLHREITAQGYTGSYSTLRDRMRWLAPHRGRRSLPTSKVPSVRSVTGWITRHPRSLTEQDAAGLETVLAGCPEV